MATWELTDPPEHLLDELRLLIFDVRVERLDSRTVNVSVATECEDDVVEFCEHHGISCRLV